MRFEVAQILKQEGYVADVVVLEENNFKMLHVVLKYVAGESVIHEIVRISKPSRRVYTAVDRIKPVIGGLGVSILTTNKGVMTHLSAREHRVGGDAFGLRAAFGFAGVGIDVVARKIAAADFQAHAVAGFEHHAGGP